VTLEQEMRTWGAIDDGGLYIAVTQVDRWADRLAALLAAHAELPLETAMRQYLDGLVITSAVIGDIRRGLFMPFKCAWNGFVRDETAKREVPGLTPDTGADGLTTSSQDDSLHDAGARATARPAPADLRPLLEAYRGDHRWCRIDTVESRSYDNRCTLCVAVDAALRGTETTGGER
jgi:hypothetical protein